MGSFDFIFNYNCKRYGVENRILYDCGDRRKVMYSVACVSKERRNVSVNESFTTSCTRPDLYTKQLRSYNVYYLQRKVTKTPRSM